MLLVSAAVDGNSVSYLSFESKILQKGLRDAGYLKTKKVKDFYVLENK